MIDRHDDSFISAIFFVGWDATPRPVPGRKEALKFMPSRMPLVG